MSDLGPLRRSPRKRKAITIIDLTNSEDEKPRTKQRKPAAASSSNSQSNTVAISDPTAPGLSPELANILHRNWAGTSNNGWVDRHLETQAQRNGQGSGSQPAPAAAPTAASPTNKLLPKKAAVEKRPKRFRDHPPQNVRERMQRCRNQPMFVLDRERADGPESLREVFKMAGSTGNVYTVTVESVPNCDCPDGQKNGTCKHILYIMIKVLHAREDLVYQAGLLQSVSLSSSLGCP